ncbi:MAG: HAD hydrolase family protein [Clostridia bacterium]|nr:HAD hydrolase family protein [Clostridia bacterium]
MRVKAIILDLDRTLLHTDKTVSSYTAAVLKECRHHAIRLMAATARPLRDAEQYCDAIGFDAMTVSNGARIICGSRRKEYGICRKSAEHLLNALSRNPALRVTLETGDRAYSKQPTEEYETILCDDLAGIAGTEGALKILVHIDSAETLAEVEKELTDDLYYTVSGGSLMQIMNKSATKWNGIQEMLYFCGCSPDSAAFFGDDYDDIEPIRMCGIGVAVANGIEEVKAAADFTAESNDRDGPAKFIERFILHKQPDSD